MAGRSRLAILVALAGRRGGWARSTPRCSTGWGCRAFVATLSGLLALLGLQLFLLGAGRGRSTCRSSCPWCSSARASTCRPGWPDAFALLPGAAMVATGLAGPAAAADRLNLSAGSLSVLVVKAATLTVRAVVAVGRLVPDALAAGRARGCSSISPGQADAAQTAAAARHGGAAGCSACSSWLAGGRHGTTRFTRTKLGPLDVRRGRQPRGRAAGRHRRAAASIISAFVLCSTLAALGGVLSAARLASSSQQAAGYGRRQPQRHRGGGDRGDERCSAGGATAYSALLGIIVIQAISNGLTLLNLSSSLQIHDHSARVLALAVIVDSLARRSRASHGRA